MKPTPAIQCPKCSAQNLPDSRFCSSCGLAFSSPSQMPTMGVPEGEAPNTAETPHVARIISSDSIPAGGFTPGTILADRYRIIGLLGRGGMGEVYRADDLKLGQPVALKFLPPRLADDAVRRERFFAEVRITRQLSHPNICRVYDIAEIDGRHFLSMEFIDGEDLASLLKRIGHLTNEKALDIARQLAAGLAAAHERGVLHRDLKPANIMLDGHGRVRITDFGLAVAVEDESQAAEIAGTPAYMAPEQLAGKGATVRSDMYSLGLVLYEIYTGKKAFAAANLAELRQQKETHTPRAPSEIREGIDPVVERLIRRCMERDPNARPSSVAQLALALPGGDPLAAAIAAGETPSPEMVAASGSKEGLRPIVAWSLLAFIIVGTLAGLAMKDRIMLHRRIPFKKPPAVLVERCKEIIQKAGYSEPFEDSDYGFISNSDQLRRIEESDKTAGRWKGLNSQSILFWYRQSPRALESPFGSVSLSEPTLRFSGEVRVILDTEGRLVSLSAVPSQVRSSTGIAAAPDWKVFFDEADLDPSQWTPAEAQWNPPFYADSMAAWQASPANRPGSPVRIEAAAYQGKPVRFEIIAPGARPARMEPVQLRTGERALAAVFFGLVMIIIAGSLFFALRNLRLGRGDRRNATRLALFTTGLTMVSWILGAHHAPTISVWVPFVIMAAVSISLGGLLWVLYMAIEPFVRRRWPQVLISWTRLMSGNWRDPLVARDALIGSVFGVLLFCSYYFANSLLPPLLGYVEIGQPDVITFGTVLGIRFFISNLLSALMVSIMVPLGLICLLFILRILLRNQKAAFAAFILITALIGALSDMRAYPIELIVTGVYLFVLMRFGLVAIALCFFAANLLSSFPITLEASAWYSGAGYTALAILAAIVLYAFRTSLGGRPMLGRASLED